MKTKGKGLITDMYDLTVMIIQQSKDNPKLAESILGASIVAKALEIEQKLLKR